MSMPQRDMRWIVIREYCTRSSTFLVGGFVVLSGFLPAWTPLRTIGAAILFSFAVCVRYESGARAYRYFPLPRRQRVEAFQILSVFVMPGIYLVVQYVAWNCGDWTNYTAGLSVYRAPLYVALCAMAFATLAGKVPTLFLSAVPLLALIYFATDAAIASPLYLATIPVLIAIVVLGWRAPERFFATERDIRLPQQSSRKARWGWMRSKNRPSRTSIRLTNLSILHGDWIGYFLLALVISGLVLARWIISEEPPELMNFWFFSVFCWVFAEDQLKSFLAFRMLPRSQRWMFIRLLRPYCAIGLGAFLGLFLPALWMHKSLATAAGYAYWVFSLALLLGGVRLISHDRENPLRIAAIAILAIILFVLASCIPFVITVIAPPFVPALGIYMIHYAVTRSNTVHRRGARWRDESARR